jgi:hypothetical protein
MEESIELVSGYHVSADKKRWIEEESANGSRKSRPAEQSIVAEDCTAVFSH